MAESGPDKVGKKEVNYWRARAEQFEQEKQEFRDRISELKQSLQNQADAAQTAAEASPEAERLDQLAEELRTENAQLVTDLAVKANELEERGFETWSKACAELARTRLYPSYLARDARPPGCPRPGARGG